MSDEFLLVTDFDLANRMCPACGHPPTDHGIVAGVCGSCDESTDCPNTRSAAARAWLDSIVRREVAKALLNLPVTLETTVRQSSKTGVQIAAGAGITPKHLSEMLNGKACRVDTWTKVLHAALANDESGGQS